MLKTGDTVYIIESSIYIREGVIARCSGGLYLVKFSNGSGIKVKRHRLYETEDEAKAVVEAHKRLSYYSTY